MVFWVVFFPQVALFTGALFVLQAIIKKHFFFPRRCCQLFAFQELQISEMIVIVPKRSVMSAPFLNT